MWRTTGGRVSRIFPPEELERLSSCARTGDITFEQTSARVNMELALVSKEAYGF